MEARIRQLGAMIENAEIVEGTDGDVVEPGCVVELRYEGDDDTDLYFFGSVEERGRRARHHQPRVAARRGARRPQARRQGRLHLAHRRQPHRRARQHPVSDPAAEPDGPAERWAPTLLPGGPLELPGRGHDVRPPPARAAGRADRAAPARHPGHRRRQLVHRLPRAGRALRRGGHRPPRPRPRHPRRAGRCAWPTAPTTRWPRSTCSASSRRSSSATRWADRSRSSCGTATAIASPGLVLCATAHRFRGVEPVLELGPALLQRLRATAEAPAKRGRARPRPAALAHVRARAHRPPQR